MRVKTLPSLEDPDGFYQELLELHAGLETEASHRLNARLVLILANHIGDRGVLREAFALASQQPTRTSSL